MGFDDDDDLDDLEWDNYDSGPYCMHWDDPTECEKLCTCGHECHEHWSNYEEYCQCKCGCTRFVSVAE